MRRILELIETALLAVATIALLLMMIGTSIDALGREFFARPLQGNFEVTGLYFMVILVFASLSANYASNDHIRVDIFLPNLRRKFGRHYDRLVAAICLPVFILFAVYASAETVQKLEAGEAVMGIVQFPVTFSYLWVAVGALTLSGRFLLDLICPRGATTADSRRKPPRA